MMDTCRTCLKTPADRTISQLEQGINDIKIKCIDIMLFCLDIKITEDSKITTNLCNNCYRKIILFYEFKALSLKNDAYLKSLEPNTLLTNEKLTVYEDENGVKHENLLDTDEYGPCLVECDTEIKQEINVKAESTSKLNGEETVEYLKDEDIQDDAVFDKCSSSYDGEETLMDDQTHHKGVNILENGSDEEPLSVVQKIKHENISNRMKENEPECNEQGCPKKSKPSKFKNTPKKRQICEECGVLVLDLQTHSISHQPKEERRTLQCAACPKMFLNTSSVYRHYRIAHLGLKPKSDICNKARKQRKRTKPIKKLPNDNNMLKGRQICEECGMLVVDLPSHSLTHQPRDQRQMLKCKACPKTFVSRGGRRRHYKISHLGMKHKCHVCDKEFVHLAAHMVQVHNPSGKRFGCTTCERRFVCKAALDQHMTIHTREMPHECDVCHKRFRAKYTLTAHIRGVHKKEKPYYCDLCSKAFFCKASLRGHIETHSTERSYQCTECDKDFMTKSCLRNHLKRHSDVKKHKCECCDMSFKTPGDLKTHMVTHTKEKAYSCQYCGKRFGRPDSCRRHETGHLKRAAD